MKKLISLLIIISIPLLANAEEVEIGGLWYNLVSKTKQAEVIQSKTDKYVGDIIIPDAVTYKNVKYSVTSIGNKAFYSCPKLTSVAIPNSVTSIGESAFQSCTSLSSVTIPNSVTSIEFAAFSNCRCLTSVTIPNSVTSIGSWAFMDCTGLTSVTISNSVSNIGWNVFYGCSSLTSVTIPNSVTSISGSAFQDCTSLSSVTIPNSVTSIDCAAFMGCSGLTTLTIGSGIKSIENQVFANCKNLADIYSYAETIPKTKSDAFDNSYPEYATLHVPAVLLAAYKSTVPWSSFGTFKTLDGEIPETTKCATPTIYYNKGKVTFASETEGVEFVADIKDSDIKRYYGAAIDLTVTYHISVYATKSGYQNSDVADATLCWIEVDPQTEGISEETAGVKQLQALPVLIQAEGGEVSVDGAPEGTRIAVYDASGVELGSAISRGGKTLVPARLAQGSIAIVKIGSRSVKVANK